MSRHQKAARNLFTLTAFVCLVFTTSSEAANFRSIRMGNWSDPTVWGYPAGSGIFPGSGGPTQPDTADVYFPIYLDVSPTIGLGNVLHQSASYDFCLENGATLTVGSGNTLTLRGSVLAYAPIILNAGGSLQFDSSISQVVYRWWSRTDTAAFVANGTATARCAVRSLGVASFILNSQTNATFHATFTDFSLFQVSSGIYSAAGTEFTLQDCTFNSCIVGNSTYLPATANLSIQRNTWLNTTASSSLNLYVNTAPAQGASYVLSGNVFDKPVNFAKGLTGLSITYNHFNNSFIDGGTKTRWNTFAYNFVRQTAGPITFDGDLYNNYFFYDNLTETDCNALAGRDVGNVTAFGNIFEARTATNVGCWAYLGSSNGVPTASTTYTFLNNIILPNSQAAGTSGMLATIENGSPLIHVVAEHNTCMSSIGMILMGDMDSPTARNQVLSCRSNIAWNTVSAPGNLIYHDRGIVADVCPPQMIGYNCGYLMAASDPSARLVTKPLKLGYGGGNTNLFSQTPLADSTDLDVNPTFVDSTRNLAKWDASLGGPGTVAHALQGLQSVYQNPGSPYTAINLINYVRFGFQPTNTTLRAIGHDGVDIGAMLVYPPAQ